MFEKQAKKEGKLQGLKDSQENLPRNPKPKFKFSILSNSYIKSYIKHYHKAYSKAEYDNDFLRRQELIQKLIKERQEKEKKEKEKEKEIVRQNKSYRGSR